MAMLASNAAAAAAAAATVEQPEVVPPPPPPTPPPPSLPPAAGPVHAVCVCHRGWEDADCSVPSSCPLLPTVAGYDAATSDPASCQPQQPCCGHGACVLGECLCEAGYHGDACARYEGVGP